MIKNVDASLIKDRREILDLLKVEGVLVLRNFCNLELLASIKERLGDIINYIKTEKNFNCSKKIGNGFDSDWIQFCQENDDIRRMFYDVIQDLPELKQFSLNECFLSMVETSGIKLPILRSSQIRMDLPEDERFLIPPHQEIKGIRSPNMIFFINPLVDINQNKGALKVAPGSNRLGPILPKVLDEVSDRYQFVDPKDYSDFPLEFAEVNYGDTIMLDMYTIHGSTPNLSEEIRWSVITRYEDAFNMPHLLGNKDWLQKYNLRG